MYTYTISRYVDGIPRRIIKTSGTASAIIEELSSALCSFIATPGNFISGYYKIYFYLPNESRPKRKILLSVSDNQTKILKDITF